MQLISPYICGSFFVFAGIMHFLRPKFFLLIMPPYIPFHKSAVFWSGVFEVVLGAMLFFEKTRSIAVFGLIALLIAVFPANIYMATDAKFAKMSPWIRYGRLPLQGLAIWWIFTMK
jgi:uncharacterized membrane protein